MSSARVGSGSPSAATSLLTCPTTRGFPTQRRSESSPVCRPNSAPLPTSKSERDSVSSKTPGSPLPPVLPLSSPRKDTSLTFTWILVRSRQISPHLSLESISPICWRGWLRPIREVIAFWPWSVWEEWGWDIGSTILLSRSVANACRTIGMIWRIFRGRLGLWWNSSETTSKSYITTPPKESL